jgi:hypothetical protein
MIRNLEDDPMRRLHIRAAGYGPPLPIWCGTIPSPPLTATSRRLLDALLAEALAPADVAETEAAE